MTTLHVVTRDYSTRTMPSRYPPVHECDRETLLDIAAECDPAWLPSEYVAAICRLAVERLEPERQVAVELAATRQQAIARLEATLTTTQQTLAIQQDLGAHVLSQRDEARTAVANWRAVHLAAVEEATRLQLLNAVRCAENTGLRNLLRVLTSGGSQPVIDVPTQIEPDEKSEPHPAEPVVIEETPIEPIANTDSDQTLDMPVEED